MWNLLDSIESIQERQSLDVQIWNIQQNYIDSRELITQLLEF